MVRSRSIYSGTPRQNEIRYDARLYNKSDLRTHVMGYLSWNQIPLTPDTMSVIMYSTILKLNIPLTRVGYDELEYS